MATNLGGLGTQASVGGGTARAANVTFALDNACTPGTSGKCVIWYFICQANTTLTDFSLFQTTTAGTGVQYTAVLYDIALSTGNISSAITNGSTTLSAPSGADKWAHFTWSTPPTLNSGTYYAIVVHNTSTTPGTNFPTVLAGGPFSIRNETSSVDAQRFRAQSFTNGNTSSATRVQYSSETAFRLKFGDGTLIGIPYTTSGTFTSNTVERGNLYPSMDATFDCTGIVTAHAPTTGTWKFYRGTTLPGGTAIGTSGTLGGGLGNVGIPAMQFLAGSQHRVVADPSSNTSLPGYYEIQDYASHADLALLRPFGGAHLTTESGGVWVETAERLASFALMLGSLPAASGGTAAVDPLGGGLIV